MRLGFRAPRLFADSGKRTVCFIGSPMPKPLPEIRRQCALRLLGLHRAAHAGHIASSLSCLEILVDLCFGRMNADDTLILSKGHAASALYTVLSLSGRLPEADLDTFYREGTLLAAHPPCSGRNCR